MTQIDPDRLRFDRSPYHRPNYRYVCGRAATWQCPCNNGPNPDGSCGGTRECVPIFNPKVNGFECRRPASAGGRCEQGPLPDGSCCRQQPACKPRLNLRTRRGVVSKLIAVLVIAVLAGTFGIGIGGDGGGDGGSGGGSAAAEVGPGVALFGFSSQSPGPLSPKHAQFTAEGGCKSCHEAHDTGASGWLQAALNGDDMTESCTSCHSFAGPPRAPHNFPDGGPVVEASLLGGDQERGCLSCHGEHEGTDTALVEFADAQCHSCHAEPFESFARGHPSFGEAYPYGQRTAVNFDHVVHFAKHFDKEADQAPEGCLGCHQVDKADRAVPTGGFDANCAACHDGGVGGNELVVFAMPEVSAAQFMDLDHGLVADLCRADPDDPDSYYAQALSNAGAAVEAGDLLGDFLPAYASEPSPVQRWLLQLEATYLSDLGVEAAESQDFLRLIEEMIDLGRPPLVERLSDRLNGLGADPEAMAERLLAGLSGLQVRTAACAFASNDFPPDLDASETGWAVSQDAGLIYRPTSHGDPIMQGWLDLATAARGANPQATDPDALDTGMRDALLQLDGDGPGSCTKCHAVTDMDATAETDGPGVHLVVAWASGVPESRPYTRYDHGPHVNLLGPGARCTDCHALNAEVDYEANFEQTNPYAYASSFEAIGVGQCTACHGRESGGINLAQLDDLLSGQAKAPAEATVAAAGGSVRANCRLCHNYHRDPAFKHQMMAPASAEPVASTASGDPSALGATASAQPAD